MRTLVQDIKSILSAGPVGVEAVVSVESAARRAFARLQDEFRCEQAPKPGRYLCYRDPETGFVILVLVWGPGDGTPIHDHGTWGVEMVLKNQLRVTNYSSCEVNPQPLDSHVLNVGDIMHNMPRMRDVHKVEHASGDYALSLHIYGTDMTQNRSFFPGLGFQRCKLECTQWSASPLSVVCAEEVRK